MYTCLVDKEGISKSEELHNTNCITSTYDYCYIAPKFFYCLVNRKNNNFSFS